MKLLVTINDSIVKTPDGHYWNRGIYKIDFFERYLRVFETIKIACRVKEVREIDISQYEMIDDHRIEVYQLPYYHGPLDYAKKIIMVKKTIRNALADCDGAVLRVPDEISFYLCREFYRSHIPFAVENVSDSWDFFKPGTFKTILRPFLRIRWYLLQKKWCLKANCVAYVTKNYIQKRFASRADNINRIESFYTSANLTSDYFYRKRSSSEFLKGDTIRLLNVAGINSFAKGHKQMIDAVKMLRDQKIKVEMIFIGGGRMVDYFKDYSKKQGVLDSVNFIGEISDRTIIFDYMKCADLFIFPTLTEGLPRALMEGMAAGLPVISSSAGGIPELLTEEMMFKKVTANEIFHKIISVVSRKKLEEMSSYSFDKIKEYSSVIISEKRTVFYQKLKKIIEEHKGVN